MIGETDWKVGDWAVFVEQGINDKWEKIDNTSVLIPYKLDTYTMDIKKKALYVAERKNPSIAGVSALLLPTAGHAYAGRWSRGLPFLLFQFIHIYILSQPQGKLRINHQTKFGLLLGSN